ncbi:MAG TPA: S8 family serine peptidase [Janthinobacterium sp.]|jgi:subtilisin family serine protease|nr:S8 family serine peptidase [Janthinobacterium sp.]
MPLQQTGPGKGRYLIRAVGDAVPLADFLSSISADPAIAIVDAIGPAGRPHTVVAEMSHDRARALEQHFNQSKQFMIEPDRPLSLFKSAGWPDGRKGMQMPKNPTGGPPSPPEPAPTAGEHGERRRTARAPGTSRGAGQLGADSASGEPGAGPTGSASGSTQGRQVAERKKRFLVAPRQPHESLQTLGLQPLQLEAVEQALRANADIEIVDTVGPKNAVGAFASGMGATQGIIVARMTEQKAQQLHQQGQGRLLVERDQHLAMLEPAFRAPTMVTGMLPAAGSALETMVLVLAPDGAPVPGAEVSLFGNLLPASGVTDDNGQAILTLYGETPHTLSGLYVKPKSDFWSFYQRDPDISTSEINVVGLRPLSDWAPLAGFPRQKVYGWGQKAMRLDQLPGNYRGQGIKIAVIDSGAATTHQNLNRVGAGFDIIHKHTSPETWNEDTLGHGSHCTAVIAGADIASGLRGFAPDAEVHACKLFPGGQISQLIDALEYCIEKKIDVVNLSLGGAEPSEALEQQLLRAKRAGIACIVAAGNSGGPVQYPASSPHVLAVAAIGKLGEFPPDSYHAETLTQAVDANGYYPASFSCHGPEIGVCAPGVAIASAVPPNNFAAWDGTSMAAPHVTGLAALALAHHPDFHSVFKARGAERVEHLFQVIKMSARRVSLGDQGRTGFGMPDVLVAVGLQAPLGRPVAQQPAGQSALGSLMGNTALAQASFGGRGGGFEPFATGTPDQGWAAYAAYLQGAPFRQQLGIVQGMPFGIGTPAYGHTIW